MLTKVKISYMTKEALVILCNRHAISINKLVDTIMSNEVNKAIEKKLIETDKNAQHKQPSQKGGKI